MQQGTLVTTLLRWCRLPGPMKQLHERCGVRDTETQRHRAFFVDGRPFAKTHCRHSTDGGLGYSGGVALLRAGHRGGMKPLKPMSMTGQGPAGASQSGSLLRDQPGPEQGSRAGEGAPCSRARGYGHGTLLCWVVTTATAILPVCAPAGDEVGGAAGLEHCSFY
jgi:hypothetical protein